jgi:hypothetical protein
MGNELYLIAEPDVQETIMENDIGYEAQKALETYNVELYVGVPEDCEGIQEGVPNWLFFNDEGLIKHLVGRPVMDKYIEDVFGKKD